MNRTTLKNYAPKARLDFIRAVTDRAAFFGLTPSRTEPMQETGDVVIIGGRAFPKVVAQQRRSLEGRIQRHGFDQVMEAMAYTWFNRFIALRYMELHGYLDHGYRVLSHPEGKATPEILEHAEHITLPGLDTQEVINLKLDGSREAELYRVLVVAQCNGLHEAMPFLFEKIADETELLLPDNLLHSDSLIRKLVNEIEEADWQQVEIIGWLYQFYISDRKDEVIGKVVKSEDIPAATQLFTPNWIVKYLVQNTLGRQWLATYPDSPLRQQMEYYIEPADQTDDVQAQLAAITPKSLDPESLTLLDPASGSGHILVEAYDLFKAIYQERGYRSKDIPRLILEKNLFGLEIDDRAAQLAAFALMMKARADDRRIFADHIQPKVQAIQESKGLENLLRPDPAANRGVGELPFSDSDLFPQTQNQLTLNRPNQQSPLAAVEPCLRELIRLFEHGKTFGSLIRVPPQLAAQLAEARPNIEAMVVKGQLWEHRAATLLLPLIKQTEVLARTYDAVITNPPFMGSSFFNPTLKLFVNDGYSSGRSDLYACFIQRNLVFLKPNAVTGMITLPNWMFITRFEEFRQVLLSHHSINTFLHVGRGLWGSDFGSCCFVLTASRLPLYRGKYRRLFEKAGSVANPEALCNRFFAASDFIASSDDFQMIPGQPVVYWVSNSIRTLFSKHQKVGDIVETREGLATADNDRFLRFWHEVDMANIHFRCRDNQSSMGGGKRWFCYVKGGPYRKWYGNTDLVVNWQNDGQEVKSNVDPETSRVRSHNYNGEYAFREGFSWSGVSISALSVRFVPAGFMFDAKGPMAFAKSRESLLYSLGILNSGFGRCMMSILSPTVDFKLGHIMNVPANPKMKSASQVVENVEKCLALATEDWNLAETSWGFGRWSLLITPHSRKTLKELLGDWETLCNARVEEMARLEESNNLLLLTGFDLHNDLTVEVDRTEISLVRPNPEATAKELASYAIGCMMGRYSLDTPGLVYAHSRNEGFNASKYQTFPADADGIIPITDIAWFPDDATERFIEFIGKAWSGEHLEGNLRFIADSLGPNRGEHPSDTIRRYLTTGFYKDHLQTYKRRPIYWLFSSGKQRAFQCLVYLHRYHEGTLARMRTEYVIPLQGKLSQRIEQLAGDITAAKSTSHRHKLEKERETLVKQRTELAAFDEKLRHYADQRIGLDLDDGVKVNYGKFGDLLAEVKAVTGGTEE